MNTNQTHHDEQRQQRDQVVARAVRNRDRTRRKLLAQGRQLAHRRATNLAETRERAEKQGSSSTSASAHSTLPSLDSNERAATQHSHSTVPERPKGSTVPAAQRLYGLELYRRLRSDPDGDPVTDTGGADG